MVNVMVKSVMWNTAFIAGSSKQGNAFLASVACIWVVATTLKKKKGDLTIHEWPFVV